MQPLGPWRDPVLASRRPSRSMSRSASVFSSWAQEPCAKRAPAMSADTATTPRTPARFDDFLSCSGRSRFDRAAAPRGVGR